MNWIAVLLCGLTAELGPVVGEAGLSPAEAVAEASRASPAARRARLTLDQAIARADSERPTLRPDLTLRAAGEAVTPTIRDPAVPNAIVRRDLSGRIELTARQTLWHGGGGALSRRADAAVAAAVADHAAALAGVRHEVMRAYIDLLAARAGLAVAEEAVSQAAAQLRRVNDLIAIERVAEADRLHAEAGLYEARAARVAAVNGVDLAQANLNRLLGRQDLGAMVKIEELDELPARLPALEDAVAYAVEHRPEVAALRARLAEALAGRDFARAERLPTIAVTGTLAAQTESAFETGTEAGLGLQVNIPLSRADDVSRRNERSARDGAAQAELALEELRTGIALEVRRAHRDESAARERYELAARRLAAAEEAHRIKVLQYDRRRATLLEVQEALLAVSRAKLERQQARYDVHRATADFVLATARELGAWSGTEE